MKNCLLKLPLFILSVFGISTVAILSYKYNTDKQRKLQQELEDQINAAKCPYKIEV